MSDDEVRAAARDGREVPFALQDVVRFAKSKGILNKPCDLCGQTAWDLEKGEQDGSSSGEGIYGTIPDNKLQTYYGAYLMICTNCGNMRFLNDSIVIAWVRQNG